MHWTGVLVKKPQVSGLSTLQGSGHAWQRAAASVCPQWREVLRPPQGCLHQWVVKPEGLRINELAETGSLTCCLMVMPSNYCNDIACCTVSGRRKMYPTRHEVI